MLTATTESPSTAKKVQHSQKQINEVINYFLKKKKKLPSSPFLSIQFSGIKYFHIAQLSPFISRTLSSCETETIPFKQLFLIPPLASTILFYTFCLYEFNYFRCLLSVESYTICLLCGWLCYPSRNVIQVVACVEISFLPF